MVDTARTIDAMQALLADNTSGDISPQDLRDMLATLCNLDTDRSEFTEGGWGDMFGSFIAGVAPATNPPVLTQWTPSNIWAWLFSVNDQLLMTFKVPHTYKVGSAFFPHVHWAPQTDIPDGQTVVWKIEWFAAPIDPAAPAVFPVAAAVTTTLTFTSSGVTALDSHLATGNGSVLVPNAEPGTMIMARVYRDTGTFVGDVWGISLSAHIQQDRFGTKNKEKPYYT